MCNRIVCVILISFEYVKVREFLHLQTNSNHRQSGISGYCQTRPGRKGDVIAQLREMEEQGELDL